MDTLFNIPNLDDLEREDYRELYALFSLLASYCSQKEQATAHRLLGRMDSALKCESNAERFYKSLPTKYRW